MKNRKLIITWMPVSTTMHLGTARSERNSFNNVKTLKAAENILSKRNKNEILFAEWNGKVIYSKPKEEAA